MHSHRTLNLNTARSFVRKGLAYSPYADTFGESLDYRSAEHVFPGHPIEITDAGRQLLEERQSDA